MTKEEYHKLLQSDYWKGFSYSIIKERNFTCEDCGAYYPNQRNKFQVHHLVYRDVAPWSYKPEEMVVLCEDCHRKRHGLYVYEPTDDTFKEKNRALLLNVWYKLKYWFGKRCFRKLFFCLLFLCVLVCIALMNSSEGEQQQDGAPDNTEEIIKKEQTKKSSKTKKRKSTKKGTQDVESSRETGTPSDAEESETVATEEKSSLPAEVQEMTPKEAKRHAKAVKKAIKAGVSTDGTTEEILERVKLAKATKKEGAADDSNE